MSSNSQTGRDFYAILDVPRSADTRTINKAYKKLALKYHPDRAGNDERSKAKFHEILTAHEILKDQQKRNIYDRYGEAGLKANGVFPTNIDDLFDLVFAGNRSNANQGNHDHDDCKQNIVANAKVQVTLADVYYAATKSVSCAFSRQCGLCNGKGFIKSERPSNCKKCAGTGYYTNYRLQSKKCTECDDGIVFVEKKTTCDQCGGRRQFTANITDQKVSIPPAAKHGDKLLLPYKNYHDGFSGNILVEIACEKDARYRVKGNDLILMEPVSVSLRDALCGGCFVVRHFNETLLVEFNFGVLQTTELYKIAGKGMLMANAQQGPARRGDLYIKCQITMPDAKSLDAATIQQLSRLLPSTQHNLQGITSKVRLQELSEWDDLGFKENDTSMSDNKSNADSNEAAPECKQM